MKKIIFLILFLLIAGVAGAVVFKDALLKVIVEQAVTRLTGFPTKVESIHYDYPATIEIKKLEVHNPAGFEQKIFASVPEVFVSLNLDELLKGEKMHLNEVRLNLSEINIEKNKQGVSNIEKLSSIARKKEETQAPTPAKKEEARKAMPFQLDRLEMTIRQVRYVDRASTIPQNVSLDMKIEKQVYQNITDPKAMINLIVVKVLTGTAIGNLVGLSPDFLKGPLSDTTALGTKLLGDTTGLLKDNAASVLRETRDVIPTDAQKKAQALLNSGTGTATGLGQEATSQAKGLFNKLKSEVTSSGSQTAKS